MQGLHLTADLHNCRCEAAWLRDAAKLGEWCLKAVRAVGLEPANQLFQNFTGAAGNPGGVTAMLLLPGSHICVHTWPARKAVVLDVYVCNTDGDRSATARNLTQVLVDRFAPEWTEQRSLDRGDES